MAEKIGLGIVGSGYIAQTHLDALRAVPDCYVAATADVDESRGKEFARVNGVERFYVGHKAMLADPNVKAVVIGVPNCFHFEVAMDAFAAGRHVICEKPLALSLEDGRRMVETAEKKGLVLGYAEELCYVPKFVRARELARSGGIGKPYLVRQCEKHAGPYSPWFWKEEEAGGGILMDMGCHSISCILWVLGKPKVKSVYAHMGTYLHGGVTKEEDHVIILMEFEDGSFGQAEASWALKGGMDSTLEIFGTEGVVKADLLKGMGLRAFSENGFPGAGDEGKGWVHPEYEELWNNGYPQEDRDFVKCMREGGTPAQNGRDGLDVLEIILAAYHSAGIGQKVYLPFRPPDVKEPVRLWQRPRPELGQGPIADAH
ncbi:MAG: Gfo/Idh/MocA family oxidoreductase [Deltaproteobacteria bacterium]|nr:Gfo/Idh/MocA family oxidoreductase [Deltaproteobacteria bacterium]